jgi:hypothetical protein
VAIAPRQPFNGGPVSLTTPNMLDKATVQRPLMGKSFSQAPRHAIAAGLLIFLAGLLPTLAVTVGTAPKNLSLLVGLHASLIVWSAVRISLIVRSGAPRFLALVFWIYVYFWLGLAPFAQLTLNSFPLPGLFPEQALTEASLTVWIGVLGFELGHLVRHRQTSNAWLAGLSSRDLTWKAVAFLTISSVVLAPLLISQFGGISTFLTSRQALDQAAALLQSDPDARTLLGVYSALLSVPPLVATLGWLQLRRSGRLPNNRPLAITVMVILIGLNIVVNNPISQSRSWFSVFIFAVLCATTWARTNRGFRIAALGMILLLVILLPFGSYFRYTQRSAPDSMSVVATQYWVSGDYDSYQQIAAGAQYVERFGFDYGAHLLGPALFWVPRSLWHEKPRDTGVVLAEFEGYVYTNLSAPLWIETYMAGGYILVFITFALIGSVWRRLDDQFVLTRPSDPGVINLIVPLLASYQTALLRGSLLTISGRLAIIVLLPLVLSSILRGQRDSHRSQQAAREAAASVGTGHPGHQLAE